MSELIAARIAAMRDLLGDELAEPDPDQGAALERLAETGAVDDSDRAAVAAYLGVPAVYLTTSVTPEEVDEQMSLLGLRRRIRDHGIDSWWANARGPVADASTAQGRQALRDRERVTLQCVLHAAEHSASITTDAG